MPDAGLLVVRRRAGDRRAGRARRARRARGAPDAGAFARRAHPDRLLRDRVPGDVPVRPRALPAHGRAALQGARQALVEGRADPVRDRRGDRHDPLVRVRPAVAGLHGHVRRRVRARLRPRGRLVLRRGDLHRDLRLRLGPAAAADALPDRDPDRDLRLRRLVQRDRRQRLDEQPAGLRRRRRRRCATRGRGRRCSTTTSGTSSIHMYLAGYIVAGFIVAGVYALRAPARAGATPTTAPGSSSRSASPRSPRSRRDRSATGPAARSRRASRSSSRRSRASRHDRGLRPVHDRRLLRRGPRARSATASRSRTCCRCSPTTTRTPTVDGLDTVPAERPAAGQRRALRVPDDGRDRHAGSPRSPRSSCSPGWRQRRLPRSPWFYRARDGRRAAVAGGADRRLDRDGGRPPAVDRLRDDARRATR